MKDKEVVTPAQVKGTHEPQSVEEFEKLIKIYKEQNPVKYELKKDELELKLDYMKKTGTLRGFNLALELRKKQDAELEAKRIAAEKEAAKAAKKTETNK